MKKCKGCGGKSYNSNNEAEHKGEKKMKLTTLFKQKMKSFKSNKI